MMGLYYNPNPPHIGAQAPLTPKNLTPPSGPAPQNPPFPGSRISQAILSCWAVAAVAIVLPTLLVPQPAQAAFVPPAKFNQQILRAWEAPPQAAIVAINLDPPISGPTPQNPPLIGARIPQAVLNAWLPAAPAPIVAINMDPPIAGPVVSNPPFTGGARIPIEIQIGWLAPAPAPILAGKLPAPSAPQAPPLVGSRVPLEILLAWVPAPPAPFTRPVRVTISAPADNPPFAGGARVSSEVLIGWLPPASLPVVGPKFAIGLLTATNPPFPGSRVPVEVQVSWLPPTPIPVVANNSVPPSAPQAPPITGSMVPATVLAWWWNEQQAPQQLRQSFYIAPPALLFPFPGARVSREVLQCWDTAAPPFGARSLVTISGPAPPAAIHRAVARVSGRGGRAAFTTRGGKVTLDDLDGE